MTAAVKKVEDGCSGTQVEDVVYIEGLKGLSHEIDFKNFDKKLHNLA